jgi:GTP cyclohydrolase I
VKRERPSRAEAEAAVRVLLAWSGDDPDRQELRSTPERVIDAFAEYFAGYGRDPQALFRELLPAPGMRGQLVMLRDIAFASQCEHHLTPFFGRAHIGFVVGERLVGLGQLAELVQIFARRLQIQERLTRQIADALEAGLEPLGVGVLLEATHTCAAVRGPCQARHRFLTASFRGRFETDAELRALLRTGSGPSGPGEDMLVHVR